MPQVCKGATVARFLVCFVCAVWGANAQQDGGLFPSRFSAGIRAGALFQNLMASQSIREARSTTNPPYVSTRYSYSSSWRYAVGPTVQFRISERAGLAADLLYRRAGYDSRYDIVTQEGEGEEGEWLASGSENTRADYWDLPIQLRYHFRNVGETSHRYYVSGGVSFRTVKGIETYQKTIVDPDKELSNSNSIAIQPAHETVAGAVAGLGVRLVDEVGTKIEIEVRYTRWFGRNFESEPTHSNLGQGEILFGISF